MSEEAVVETTQQTPSAESQQEPSIPKHRFDQVAMELRSLKEAIQIKDQAIAQLSQAMPGRQQPDEDEEVLQAMDPAQLKAVRKIIGKELERGRQEIGGVIGALGNRVEEQSFLLNHGKDKAKYLERIRDMKRDHAMRGQPLDYETAYKFIRLEELEVAATKPERKPEAPAVEKKEDAPPPAKLTQQRPAAQDRTIEDIEAELDEQIKASGGRF